MSIIDRSWKKIRCLSTEKWMQKIWYIYTVESYSAIRNEFMKFLGKWMELEIILSEVTQSQKITWHVLTDKLLLAQKFRIPKI